MESTPRANAAEMFASSIPMAGFHWEVEFQIGQPSFN